MPDRDALELEVETLRERVAELQRRLALNTREALPPARRGALDVSLAEREELLLEAERIAHVGTWVWDLDTGGVFWSEGLYRIFGYDSARDAATIENFFAAIHPDDREEVRRTSARVSARGVGEPTECRVVHRDGTVRRLRMDASFLCDEAGRSRRAVGTALDITELCELQEKLAHAEKMEAIGRLAAGVAHDFNNALMVVRGNLELMGLSEGQELQKVLAGLDSARELTARLLTLGRRSPLRRRVLDLNDLVRNTLGLMDRLIREQVTLRVRVADEPTLVHADETLLEQALVNLLLNAREALPAGGGHVDVTVSTVREAEYEVAELSVRDDGPGMDDATRARVFEPFFTTKSGARGHGLGLAMVHGTISQHGGSVSVESTPGQGTTFRLRLPRVGHVDVAPGSISTLPPAPRRTGSVLVVEDQETVGHTIRQLLEHLGHSVHLVPNGSQALDAVHARAFDVLLCDVMMPDMRGPVLVERIAQRVPNATHRVVFMTGNSSDQGEAGAEIEVLHKPFTLEQLDQTIGRALASGKKRSPGSGPPRARVSGHP